MWRVRTPMRADAHGLNTSSSAAIVSAPEFEARSVGPRTDRERSPHGGLVVAPHGGRVMNQILILSSNAGRTVQHANMIVVATPLDAINQLEDHRSIATVILSGNYAGDDELTSFLSEAYPQVHLEHEA